MKHGGKRPGAGRKSFETEHGQPPVELTIRVTQSQHRRLIEESDNQGISIAELMRRLIDASLPG